MKNIICWFEIPALDFDRCQKFYETILDLKMHSAEIRGIKHAFFPHEADLIGGAIVQEKYLTPGDQGPMMFIDGGNDLTVILNKIEAAGGKITMSRTLIAKEIGYQAQFKDTEGNRFALYEAVVKS